jgi:hypothetical protein
MPFAQGVANLIFDHWSPLEAASVAGRYSFMPVIPLSQLVWEMSDETVSTYETTKHVQDVLCASVV